MLVRSIKCDLCDEYLQSEAELSDVFAFRRPDARRVELHPCENPLDGTMHVCRGCATAIVQARVNENEAASL